MSLTRESLSLKTAAREVEAVLRRLLAPSMIVGVLVAFLALTFMAAKLLAHLLEQNALGSILLLWALTAVASVALVRQLPRALK
jgi:hypothetical protein